MNRLLAISLLVLALGGNVAVFSASPALAHRSAKAIPDVASVPRSGFVIGDPAPKVGTSSLAVAEELALPFHEGVARTFARRSLAAADYWGGTYTSSAGTQVRLYASPAYAHNDQWLQGWTGFFDALIHGSELSRLTLVFLPESSYYFYDLHDACGPDAEGCYDPSNQILFAPGNHLSTGTRMETVIAHEYGHHIAANRTNAPWDANTWGPKRWASQMNICARTQAGQAFPGDEGSHYTLNPGEGFAEAYRLTVFNSHNWINWPPTSWNIVDPSFMPDYLAQSAVRSDVLFPWDPAVPTVLHFSGKLTKRRRAVMLDFPTTLDGNLTVRLFQPYRATLTLIDASGVVIGTRSGSFTYTVCGDRTMRIQLRGPAGSRYRLEVATP